MADRWLSKRWTAKSIDLSSEEVSYLLQLIEDDLGEAFFNPSERRFPEDRLPVSLLKKLTAEEQTDR